MSAQDPPSLAGGRYRVDAHLRRRTYVDEWQGHDLRLDRVVTIRVLRPDLDDEEVRARVVAHLRHAVRVEDPGLTRIYDSLGPEVVGIVAEPIVGDDLRSQVLATGPMSVDRARSIVVELAKTLDTAHRAGLVHGGLDASSVGYTSDGRLVIGDMGAHGVPVHDEDAVRDDVRALAAILHELTCGRPPHDRGRGLELDPSVPMSIAGLLEQAFGTNDPFRSAQHFAAAASHGEVADVAPEVGFASAERRWLVPALVVIALAVVLGGVGALISRTTVGRDIIDNARGAVGLDPEPITTTTNPEPTTAAPTTTRAPAISVELPILRITDFDPDGNDGTEHPERLVLINDGDPARGWQTELYTTRDFGRLKGGVGLVIELPAETTLDEITVRSPTRGWGFRLFASTDPPVAAEWGGALHDVTDISSDTTLDLDGHPVRSLLLWITDLGDGPQFRVTITDVELRGAPIAGIDET